MSRRVFQTVVAVLLIACTAFAQTTTDPFPNPIPTTDRVIAVKFTEFAKIPDSNGMTPRIMTMVNEPGTRRFFASAMFGKLYAISYDGKTVTPYLDLTLAKWEVDVQAMRQKESRKDRISCGAVQVALFSAEAGSHRRTSANTCCQSFFMLTTFQPRCSASARPRASLPK